MNKLSPQKDYILSFLRKGDWVCGRVWLSRVKDDRKRIGEMREYMASKGYEIASKPCKGAYCGVKDCPLYARRAQRLTVVNTPNDYLNHARKLCEAFDAGKSASQIFSVV